MFIEIPKAFDTIWTKLVEPNSPENLYLGQIKVWWAMYEKHESAGRKYEKELQALEDREDERAE